MTKQTLLLVAGALFMAAASLAHPLDGLTTGEFHRVKEILQAAGKIDSTARFHEINLDEPDKETVRQWHEGMPEPRKALAVISQNKKTYEAVVDLAAGAIVSFKEVKGEGAILLEEVVAATDLAIADPRMIAGLAKRDLKPEQVFCLPLTAGAFGLAREAGKRLINAPCFVKPGGSHYYAKPVEGLFATLDVKARRVEAVTDTGVVPVPKEDWGYTEAEVEQYAGPLRPAWQAAKLAQSGEGNVSVAGGEVRWDIWRFRVRADKRPGVVLSLVDVRDGERWRPVAYQMNLSEVFVPYMDPDKGWNFRTYMDSGEYGFGTFLTPLKRNVDCPAYARFLSMSVSQDNGEAAEIPGAVCVFERNIGDPAWRHFESFAQSGSASTPTEGRPATELVVRSASEVGNYDYLIDYVFQQDGTIRAAVGASGIDAVKGVASRSMADSTARADTRFGTLIAPNLVAPVHSHFFNFRLDLDIDGAANDFERMRLVPCRTSAGTPRRSLFEVSHEMPATDTEARTRIDPAAPAVLHFVNHNVKGALGHEPGYMLDPSGSFANSLLSADDPPFKRNSYVAYQVWVTPYRQEERYAGGRFAVMSSGADTLGEWTSHHRPIGNRDIVVWYTMGFHHVPRMEDWPVMPTHWNSFALMPQNFFAHNPAMTIRNEP